MTTDIITCKLPDKYPNLINKDCPVYMDGESSCNGCQYSETFRQKLQRLQQQSRLDQLKKYKDVVKQKVLQYIKQDLETAAINGKGYCTINWIDYLRKSSQLDLIKCNISLDEIISIIQEDEDFRLLNIKKYDDHDDTTIIIRWENK